jgi:flagellin-specific chaperone FliS
VQLLHRLTTQSTDNAQLSINQAQNIIAQLERSLKVDDQLSRSLYLLYDYCYCQLEKDRVDEWRKALLIMSNLRDTFDQLHMPARV